MKKDVLIIDDDSRNIFALSLILRSKGFTCHSATDAHTGIQLLTTNPRIGIVLLDMMMPGMDGYQTLEKLRAGGPFSSLPIVAVTAQAMAGDREKCLAAGASAYVAKPINVEELISVLNKYIG